jgi:hypothetical protein
MNTVELDEWHRWWNARGALELRTIFLTDWDPLLVGDAAQAQDEYDGYLGELGDLLRKGAGGKAVAEYLASCEGRMGFTTGPDELTDVAARITQWYSSAVAAAATD